MLKLVSVFSPIIDVYIGIKVNSYATFSITCQI